MEGGGQWREGEQWRDGGNEGRGNLISHLVVGIVVVPRRSWALGHSSWRVLLMMWHTQMGVPRQPRS